MAHFHFPTPLYSAQEAVSGSFLSEASRMMAKRKLRGVALYLRVSTSEQTVENQRRELTAVAERRRWWV